MRFRFRYTGVLNSTLKNGALFVSALTERVTSVFETLFDDVRMMLAFGSFFVHFFSLCIRFADIASATKLTRNPQS